MNTLRATMFLICILLVLPFAVPAGDEQARKLAVAS
jgi:hypothetical protein